MVTKLPNGGRISRVLEQIGVSYAPRPLLSIEAFTTATRKRKADMSKKTVAKKVK
jgi:hypothetical protein